MPVLRRTLVLVLTLFSVPLLAQEAEATSDADLATTSQAVGDEAAEKFITRCSGCHTVGGGSTSSGPDLLSTTRWATPELTAAVRRMEKKAGPIDPADVQRFVELLRDPKVRDRLDVEKARAVAEAAARYEPNADVGHALFFGARRLENGGLACSSCHQMRGLGGTLGPDLTWLGGTRGETALVSAIEKTSFNVMRTAYADHPVTREEAFHLTAYFQQSAAGASPDDAAEDDDALLLPLAGGGLGLLLLAFLALFSSSHASGTRARLVQNARRQ